VPGTTLRLIWPQWQGAGSSSVRALAAEFPFAIARRGYTVGSAVLDAIVPPTDGPTATVSVPVGDEGTEIVDGIEAKAVILAQLSDALEKIAGHDPERILTLGGDCAVSVAPFAYLAARYPDDLAIVWIDSHPDVDTPQTAYAGYHAMAVSALVGRGDQDVLARLPATVDAGRVALAGLHSWQEDAHANIGAWGLTTFAPDDLRDSSRPLLDWVASTGCSKLAVHFDVDTIDSNEMVYGLGAEPDRLTGVQVRRILADLAAASDVVGLTIAEFIPRQVIALQQIIGGFPLVSGD
jgi:arginase